MRRRALLTGAAAATLATTVGAGWWLRERAPVPVATEVPTGTATIVRTDLSTTTTMPGTLGFTGAYEVYAIRYGTLPAFRVRSLVAGADTARRMDIALMVWLLRGPGGRTVLVDAGFHREKFLRQWKPAERPAPSRRAGRTARRC